MELTIDAEFTIVELEFPLPKFALIPLVEFTTVELTTGAEFTTLLPLVLYPPTPMREGEEEEGEGEGEEEGGGRLVAVKRVLWFCWGRVVVGVG